MCIDDRLEMFYNHSTKTKTNKKKKTKPGVIIAKI